MTQPTEAGKKSVKDLIAKQATDTEKLAGFARLAESAERYPDMVVFMHELIDRKNKDSKAITTDERNLLSVAYKNVVGTNRSSWRVLKASDEAFAQKYRTLVEAELKTNCNEILNLLKAIIEKDSAKKKEAPADKDESKKQEKDASAEETVFWLKMRGDYYRYLSEVFSDPNNEEHKGYRDSCAKFYKEAMEAAEKDLQPTHPTRLGLALNFSVCYYEILKEKDEAKKLAKKAFDEAIEKLDTLNDDSYKDSTLIMQLLRDNLTLWTQENEEEPQES